MSLYNINDIVYCTNTTWLHEQCKITEIVQNSTVPEETVYEAQSLTSQEVLLVSEDCVTLTPKLNIKQLRISTRLSQAKFAHKFKIPTRTLQKWEIGQSSPPPYVISMIQQILEQEKEHLEKDKLFSFRNYEGIENTHDARIKVEQELNRLHYVLDKLQGNSLPPTEELISLLKLPESTCGIEPTWTRASVKAEIIIYEAALEKLKKAYKENG